MHTRGISHGDIYAHNILIQTKAEERETEKREKITEQKLRQAEKEDTEGGGDTRNKEGCNQTLERCNPTLLCDFGAGTIYRGIGGPDDLEGITFKKKIGCYFLFLLLF